MVTPHLALDHGEVTFHQEADGLRIVAQVDPRGNYVAHRLDDADVASLRAWLSADTCTHRPEPIELADAIRRQCRVCHRIIQRRGVLRRWRHVT